MDVQMLKEAKLSASFLSHRKPSRCIISLWARYK